MNALQLFKYAENSVRTGLYENGEPWFVAKDICDILGIRNSRQALAKLDEDEKGVFFIDTLGGKQEMATVNESGLYVLIFLSRKAEAKKFRKWVTSELLPTLRKEGSYELKLVDPLSFKSDIKYNSEHISGLLGVDKIRLYKALRGEGYVHGYGTGMYNLPTTTSLKDGIMVIDNYPFTDSETGELKIKAVSRFTPKFIKEVLPILQPLFHR